MDVGDVKNTPFLGVRGRVFEVTRTKEICLFTSKF
jgi:hypothetical protein